MNDKKKPSEEDENFEIESIGGEAVSNGKTVVSDDEILALRKETEKLKSDYLYLRADFDNYRKAKIKETAELSKYGSRRIIIELLNVIDTLERALALEVTSENISSFKDGLQMTAREFNRVLSDFGVKEIDTLNKPFDPNTQEAISSESTDEIPEGHVLRVFKKGYQLHDLLVRPAQVVVAQPLSKDRKEDS